MAPDPCGRTAATANIESVRIANLLSRWWRARTPRPPAGQIDPRAGAALRPPFKVTGWVLVPETTVASVEIAVDGRPIGKARVGLERLDVAEEHAHPDAPVCGFEHVVVADDLPSGATRVSVTATARDLSGRVHALAAEELTLAG